MYHAIMSKRLKSHKLSAAFFGNCVSLYIERYWNALYSAALYVTCRLFLQTVEICVSIFGAVEIPITWGCMCNNRHFFIG